ncbi:hypothetical protein HT576_14705 [Haloterrigena sp. SYSU A121-1]|uniref:DUF8152 domain-containing protein n=1 Tax=Haloterrigena gelatinilytica TaxID=2741724 RepID=A0A8J8GN96_9EURY|nr:hypothetical protein [Haloterrigena gelatinilytica]NUB92265.1 hypothetical protein [Haloterrigena gelatinilytica]
MTDDPSPPERSDDEETADAALAERARQLHRHLEATAELPIDRTANRWLGEAEAVAADVATSDLDTETILERVEKVQHLLAEVAETGHEGADDHLEAAKTVCTRILEDDGSSPP